ncbi:hypothetical protein [Erythrobacter aurantius]|uniref:hypothetical protein n=1 Tax=Erythrobacter aurantius TaxID=2909249 RepID=UPI00207AD7D3|nr:hypothetical protein [Erythrobacter aurantius]
MTTLLSWMSVKGDQPSAIYIVTDSRITWGSAENRWDGGRKVFATRHGDIFGYCGEAFFPSQIIGQLCDLANLDILWTEDTSAEEKNAIFVGCLRSSLSLSHADQHDDFWILQFARDGDGPDCEFKGWKIKFRKAEPDSIQCCELDLTCGGHSKLIATLGSGGAKLKNEILARKDQYQGGKASVFFEAFCDLLEEQVDPLSGGAPQIVSIDQESPGKFIGFKSGDDSYVGGFKVERTEAFQEIEWRDETFTYLDWRTLKRASGAQRNVKRPRKS